MAKVAPITGFPEWLPRQKLAELHVIEAIRKKFELYGFSPIETRSVEPLDWLLKKGETDKEIYVVRRLHADESDPGPGLGLHFDLTIPFARFATQNRGQLQFPLRRYQIQKAWRGERPQEGRYREFYQADADVITEKVLPIHYDAEMVVMLHDIVSSLPIPPVRIMINNRKLLEGFYKAIGAEPVEDVLRVVDKLDKRGRKAIGQMLVQQLGLAEHTAQRCLDLSAIQATSVQAVGKQIEALGARHELLDQGFDELSFVLAACRDLPEGAVIADLRIARGFDYYTGTVYEGLMVGHESVGAVCSGGRYDELASTGGAAKLPGIGISIGVTRLLGRLFGQSLLDATRSTPTCVVVALASESDRAACNEVARVLRMRGIASEVFHEPLEYGKQIRHAARRGVPFMWFPRAEGSGKSEVRDLRTGEQRPADPGSWMPPASELYAGIVLRDVK